MTALGEFVVEQPHRRRIAGPEPSGARVGRGPSAYDEALRSRHWRELRQAAARRSEPRWPRRPPRCEWCRWACPTLQLHHRNYIRLGTERLHDVWLLCPRCHGRADRRRRERQGRGTKVRGIRLMRGRGPAAERPRRGDRGEAANPTELAPPLDVAQRPMSQRAGRGLITLGPLVPAGGAL